jgi:hypothetical protein
MKLDRTVCGVFLNDFSFKIGDPQTHRRPFNPNSQSAGVKTNGCRAIFCRDGRAL